MNIDFNKEAIYFSDLVNADVEKVHIASLHLRKRLLDHNSKESILGEVFEEINEKFNLTDGDWLLFVFNYGAIIGAEDLANLLKSNFRKMAITNEEDSE